MDTTTIVRPQAEDVPNRKHSGLISFHLLIERFLVQFFSEVFKRMFILQNPEYDFDDEYLQCVTSKMSSLKPFGETPAMVMKSLRQAFVAARTFVQGLAIGRNVALRMAQVTTLSTPVCRKPDLIRMMERQ